MQINKKKIARAALCAALTVVLGYSFTAMAAETKLIPFQGKLTKADGQTIEDGALVVQFKLYDAPVGGNAVWNGEIQKLSVNGGLVSTVLGTKSSLKKVDFSESTYLEITIDANGDNQIGPEDPPLLPRQSIIPAVFAAQAAEAKNAENAENAEKLNGYDWSVVFADADPQSGIPGGKLKDGSIPASKIANKSITASQLADSTITTAKIAKGAVTSDHLAANSITVDKLIATGILAELLEKNNNTNTQKGFKRLLQEATWRVSQPVEEEDWGVPLNGGGFIDMIWVKPTGTDGFTMGSPMNEAGRATNEVPHKVTLSGFWLGKYEVTQSQWIAVMGTRTFGVKGDNMPVDRGNYDTVMNFCDTLTEIERNAGRLSTNYKYTLPTEAQWEYACRAGSTNAFYDYEDPPQSGKWKCYELNEIGWYKDNSGGKIHSVGQKQPNAWGFYDMNGNIWEWCLDWYGVYDISTIVQDPEGPTKGSYHVLRGGRWDSKDSECRSAYRGKNPSNYEAFGFRLALVPVK